MKKSITIVVSMITVCLLVLSSCKKNEVANPYGICTLTFNDTIHRTADSIHYDYLSGTTPRVQAFIGSVAVFTLYPGSVATNTHALSSQYLYWIVQSPTIYTVNPAGGTVTITNNADVLSGSLSATGSLWTGTGPATSKIEATFSNVRRVGN